MVGRSENASIVFPSRENPLDRKSKVFFSPCPERRKSVRYPLRQKRSTVRKQRWTRPLTISKTSQKAMGWINAISRVGGDRFSWKRELVNRCAPPANRKSSKPGGLSHDLFILLAIPSRYATKMREQRSSEHIVTTCTDVRFIKF